MSPPLHCSRRRALTALALACVAAPWVRTATASGATLHFYSPERNINNFGALKGEFDGFFAGSGGHRFQPYSDGATFEKALQGGAGVFLTSSWQFARLAGRAVWRPMLIGQFREKATQRHVLCANKSVTSVGPILGKKVASAGNKAFTLDLLSDLLGAEQIKAVSDQNVLPVPKDLDALMTIGFGLAQAAIATEYSLDELAKTNARRHADLAQLAKGSERLLPIVAANENADFASRALLDVLKSMGADSEGRQRLRLLGLDALAPVTDAQLKELQK